jgi:hypothetical protein
MYGWLKIRTVTKMATAADVSRYFARDAKPRIGHAGKHQKPPAPELLMNTRSFVEKLGRGLKPDAEAPRSKAGNRSIA